MHNLSNIRSLHVIHIYIILESFTWLENGKTQAYGTLDMSASSS
jgi:hypothetical protein